MTVISPENSRTVAVLGTDGVERLAHVCVAVFGVGGVGGHLAEALARAGVGAIDLIDRDTVSLSNINRQAVAYHSTLGQPKVDVMAERIADIAPDCRVCAHEMFYLPETAEEIDLSAYDYVADCVDTVAAKIELAVRCANAHVPLISAMGAGNKLHPERIRLGDIFKTEVDPLARIMRRELKARGIRRLLCAWSDESPIPSNVVGEDGRPAPGSVSFVPSAMGLIMAGEIVRYLASCKN